MTKHNVESPEQSGEKESYTKEEMQQIVQDSMRRQLAADELRAHGNAFFAEALDHVGTLAARDPFWKRVYDYGVLFKRQFEQNSGQVAPPQQAPAKSKSAAKPAPDDSTDETPGGEG